MFQRTQLPQEITNAQNDSCRVIELGFGYALVEISTFTFFILLFFRRYMIKLSQCHWEEVKSKYFVWIMSSVWVFLPTNGVYISCCMIYSLCFSHELEGSHKNPYKVRRRLRCSKNITTKNHKLEEVHDRKPFQRSHSGNYNNSKK